MNTPSLLGLVLLVGMVLSGCVASDKPPFFSIDEVRYWFEGDLVVVNVTITNQADFTPGPPRTGHPDIWLSVDEFVPKPPGASTSEDLVSGPWDSAQLLFSTNMVDPWRTRYYSPDAYDSLPAGAKPPRGISGTVGPLKIHPGDSVTTEFAFLPEHRYMDRQGYYVVDISVEVLGESADNKVASGCFNHNTSEFYGVDPDGPDCVYYSRDHRWTSMGVELFGAHQADSPMMVHDPPAGVPGAH